MAEKYFWYNIWDFEEQVSLLTR